MIDIDEIFAWYNTEPDTYWGNIPRILMYAALTLFIFFVLLCIFIYRGYCYIVRRPQPDLKGMGFVLYILNERPELKTRKSEFKTSGDIRHIGDADLNSMYPTTFKIPTDTLNTLTPIDDDDKT